MADIKGAKTISFSIYKGGTGKTTSAVNTAASLAEMSKRVLLVDLDQQPSATRYLGFDRFRHDQTHLTFGTAFEAHSQYDMIIKEA